MSVKAKTNAQYGNQNPFFSGGGPLLYRVSPLFKQMLSPCMYPQTPTSRAFHGLRRCLSLAGMLWLFCSNLVICYA